MPFIFRQRAHCGGQGCYAPLAAFPHQADALRGRFEADAATVFGGVPADELGALEAGDDAAHGWRADLFGIGKFAKRFRSAENEDGKCGELRGADAAFAVANAKAAQQVNGSGVELVGEFDRCGVRRRKSG